MRNIILLISLVIIFNNLAIIAQNTIDKFTASINGTIIYSDKNSHALISSENGKFWCTYEVIAVADEIRELSNLRMYNNENQILSLMNVPGSDVSLTNSGKLVFYDHTEHFKGIVKLQFYSKEGEFLFTRSFKNADLFEFSATGEKIGIRTSEGISVFSLSEGNSYLIEKGLQFSFDEDDNIVAVAQSGIILVYENSQFNKIINTQIELPRKVIISSKNNLVAVIDKFYLKVYSLSSSNLIFDDKVSGNLSYRDLKIEDGKLIAGIHKKNKYESYGLLRIYDFDGTLLQEKTGDRKELKKLEKINLKNKTQSNYNPIPWPFFPFDSMRTVWNHYEQHMGLGGSDSYLHQGLDLITPIGEPTYSVINGYVKLVLTIGGVSYWRIAVSDTQIAGRSNGWLSAHLIESTIQFDVGDTVQVHDYLGDIIAWSGNWGHIHFVNISDSGLVWLYSDDEWGINFNPSLVLSPYPDTTAPYIDTVFPWSKFAFALNESDTYLNPDSLFGSVDIIVKVVDYVGDSEWQQPAYTTFYTIKRISDGDIIQPKTMGHILNHSYPFYGSGNYQPYAGVIYQRDNTLQPSSWNDINRNYYHNLTNSNGDSLVELSERTLSFNTENFPDGYYRIIVEVYDEAGNFDIDSMNVRFYNNPVNSKKEKAKVYSFNLDQNYPNPFNPNTRIKFTIPEVVNAKFESTTLKVYDVLGNEIATLVNEALEAGEYEVTFDPGSSMENPASGIYFYQLQAGEFFQAKKMVLIK